MQRRESVGVIIWRFIYPLLIYLGVQVAIEVVFMYAQIFKLVYSGEYSMVNIDALITVVQDYIYSKSILISLLSAVIVVPVLGLFIKKDIKRDEYYGRPVKYSPYNKAWLLLLPVVGFAAAVGFNHVVPPLLEALQSFIHTVGKSIFGMDWNVDFFATYNKLEGYIYSDSIWVQVLSLAVAAPLMEEFLFRGLIFKRMRAYLKPVPSILISAFVFGLMHGNAVQFVYAFILGIFMAYVYEKFKTIWASVVFHAGANLISLVVTMIMPEGGYTLPIGTYMLVVVIELAVVFLLLKLIDMKVNRQPAAQGTNEEQ